MSQISAKRQVLLGSANHDTQKLMRKALSVSSVDGQFLGCSQNAQNLDKIQCPLPQFSLVCVESVHQILEKITEAKSTDNPISILFIEIPPSEWEMVRDIIEQVWEYDPTLRCVFLPSPEGASKAHGMDLSRPDQWVVLRIPLYEHEIFQLACCLSARFPACPVPEPNRSGHVYESCNPLDRLMDDDNWEDRSVELESTRDELAVSRYYVDNILRSMADSLFVINADMTIGAVNPSLLTLLGYQEEDLVGESPGLIFGEEFAHGAIIENLVLQGSVSGVESSFLTRGGHVIPISVSGSMMQDRDGHFQGLVCVAQDITERKRMEEEKRQLHEQLLETSRQLGMAEVATGVLHNVGNVLNSINVSIGVITDLLKNSIVGDVGRISQLFEKHREDLGTYLSQNPKGKQVPGYLEKLSGQLVEEKRVALLELDRLRENTGHAQQCVAAQQDLAKPNNIKEPVILAELVSEALSVNHSLLEKSGVEVMQEFHEVPQIIVDKHQVLQILVDVIRNGCQAMESVPVKQLVVGVTLIIGPPDSVCLEVKDTGKGIDPGDITKIFGQGFSTEYGRRGMSLHRGALMAKNMGGALRAQSEGAGRGTSFFLDLPGDFYFPNM